MANIIHVSKITEIIDLNGSDDSDDSNNSQVNQRPMKKVKLCDSPRNQLKPKEKKNVSPITHILLFKGICDFDLSHISDLRNNKITIKEIQKISETIGLKNKSGKKIERLNRLLQYIEQSISILKIQTVWRKHIYKEIRRLQGPACFKRSICNNPDDFLTTEETKDIPYDFFFSFRDSDNFVYGFNMLSLYQLSRTNKLYNPYNRKTIPQSVVQDISNRIRLNHVVGKSIKKYYDDFYREDQISEEKMIENEIISICQQLDLHGYYSKPEWFINLNTHSLKTFLYELMDLWNYRAQLSIPMKIELCKPYGNPFRGINLGFLNSSAPNNIHNKLYVIRRMINVVKNLLQESVVNSMENKSMCAMYVLTALCIVNQEVAETFPWLYQSII